MNLNVLVYLAEIIICISIMIIYSALFWKHGHKRILKFFGICFGLFIAILVCTFVFEIPTMEYQSVYTIEAKSDERLEKPDTYYHFRNVKSDVEIEGKVDYDKIGEYEIEFQYDSWFRKISKKTTVKVVDTTSPEIIIEQGEEYNLSYSKEFIEPGVKADDNYDGDISENIVIEKNEIDETHFDVKYSVKDSSENKAEKIRHVTIVDDVPPEITLNGIENIYILPGGQYEEKGATAVDEKDGDLTDKISIEGTVDTSKEGEYTVTYKVSDSKGNEGVKQRKIFVQTQISIQGNDGTNGGKGVIYLTFDDGPSSNITPVILDILKEKNVKATFFVLNYNSTGEELIKREVAEGHTVAIHGYSHEYKTIYQSEEAYMNNITSLQEKIFNSTGYRPTITRFPGGSSNTVSRFNPGIMTRLCKIVLDNGFKYFDWNVSSGDAGGATNSEEVYEAVIGGLSKERANVVLMHDFSTNEKVLDALPRIIDYGIQNGYTFSNITESTPMVTHTPNN